APENEAGLQLRAGANDARLLQKTSAAQISGSGDEALGTEDCGAFHDRAGLDRCARVDGNIVLNDIALGKARERCADDRLGPGRHDPGHIAAAAEERARPSRNIVADGDHFTNPSNARQNAARMSSVSIRISCLAPARVTSSAPFKPEA